MTKLTDNIAEITLGPTHRYDFDDLVLYRSGGLERVFQHETAFSPTERRQIESISLNTAKDLLRATKPEDRRQAKNLLKKRVKKDPVELTYRPRAQK